MIITIDGPTASGKSTTGRSLAKELNFYYLYTGLLYRALAYLLMHKYGYDLSTISHPDMQKVDEFLNPSKFEYRYDSQDRERIFFNGTDITDHLKGDRIGQAASILSTNTEVRNRLNELQRTIANSHNVVIDGRDSGSVVFPHAEKKFFLTALKEVRAERWRELQRKRGTNVSFEEALDFVQTRDARDSNRHIAPLIIPKGAEVIDSSTLTKSQTLNALLKGIKT